MIALDITHEIFYCVAHKIHIYYFPSTKIAQETVCWGCIREANAKKSKAKVVLDANQEQEAKEEVQASEAPTNSGATETGAEATGDSSRVLGGRVLDGWLQD